MLLSQKNSRLKKFNFLACMHGISQFGYFKLIWYWHERIHVVGVTRWVLKNKNVAQRSKAKHLRFFKNSKYKSQNDLNQSVTMSLVAAWSLAILYTWYSNATSIMNNFDLEKTEFEYHTNSFKEVKYKVKHLSKNVIKKYNKLSLDKISKFDNTSKLHRVFFKIEVRNWIFRWLKNSKF